MHSSTHSGAFKLKFRKTFVLYPNHEVAWNTTLQLFSPIFKEITNKLIKVAQDIFNLFGKDEGKQKTARDKTFTDLETLYKKIDSDGLQHKGEHANGHIASGLKGAADFAIAKLSTGQSPPGEASDIGVLADALRIVCTKLSALPTDGHGPWLRADWQLSYQGSTQVAAAGLE